MRAHQVKNRGFTLLELLVTLAIVAVLWGWADDPLTALKVRSQSRSMEADLEAGIAHARMRALQQRTDVVMCARVKSDSSALIQCRRDNQWADGWLIFNDNNRNWQVDTGETLWLNQLNPLNTSGFSVTNNALITPYAMRFNAFGLTTTKATFALSTPTGEKRYLCMGAGARVRTGDVAGC